MGRPGSPKWNLILDGAESILLEEGYASLTSRGIAERIGIKQRLVYYYFHTMEDIYVETFRRKAGRELERLAEALGGDLPLHEVWDVCIHTLDARWISEFMALANRSAGVRDEVVGYIEKTRDLQVEALNRTLAKRKPAADGLPPVAVTFMATSIALALTREAQLGISKGHREVQKVIGDYLSALEPDEPAKKAPPRSAAASSRKRVRP
jgi:AcrR family transcriptional regulator